MDAAKKATTIRDAWLACELGPLSGPTQAWRMDLSEARGTKAHTRLETYLELRDPGRFVHSAFTGHRGCGKSTELLRLKQKWDKNLFVVYFEVTDLLDPNDIAFSDLFLAISMQLAQAFHDAEMPLDRRILKSVESFAASVIQETTNATKAQIEAGATVEAGGAIPFFGKLKAWITSQYKASTDHKQTIRRIFERDITRLITDTNLLLDDAREKLRRANRGQTDLLIILDNLDRIPPDVGEKLVFQHGDSLKQLRTNVIYTVPVSVLHSPKGLEHVFAKHDILPMVKVFRYSRRAKNLRWDAAGVAALVDALGHRVDIESVFESADLAADLAKHSGGCLRHLMQLACYALESAHASQAKKVAAHHVEDALRRMQFDFERMIPPEHYPLLAEVARTRNVPNSEVGRAALFNVSALEYNGGKRWNYVHPLVLRIDQFTEHFRAQSTKAKTPK